MTTYVKLEFSKYLLDNTCKGLYDKVLLLTTGSEANEAAIKMAKIIKYKKNTNSKNIIISFENSSSDKAELAFGVAVLSGEADTVIDGAAILVDSSAIGILSVGAKTLAIDSLF